MQGVLLHAIDRKGNDIYKRAAGTSALGPTSPPISFTNTIRLASCTKLVTTIAALQCVERGLLALDAPLDALLPELCSQPIITSYNAASSAAAASLTFAQRTKPLTLRHLLTHTSGVGYDTLQPALRAHRASRGEAGQTTTPSAAIATAFGVPLLFEPGDGWAYGGGLDWAGVAVERALQTHGGGELEDCVQERVFGPLGLRDSTFRLERREGVRERLVEMALKG
ncbi:putative beta-lactamase protein [Neofusicoccum parvum UCRNP2]|uniref:Putative beta-lactamase protein n=1 Tax=Botryosphaeria parva (strain UCR-NP2) TaxID=1287680 RepID=R1EE70_BOTPV|nr:putative beta-lactamase protein [Neofusicoccum parvum UCRNP2]